MTIIKSLINGLGHFFQNSTDASRNICGIPYQNLINIFQINNHGLFVISDKVELEDEGIQLAASNYEQIGSQVAEHLCDKGHTTITTKSEYIREDGAAFLFIEYKRTNINNPHSQPAENWATFQLSTLTLQEGKLNSLPHFTMTGIYHAGLAGGLLFIPKEVRCLIEENGELFYHQPEVSAELQAATAYANQALMQLLSGAEIDIANNQQWMNPKRYEEAARLCEGLLRRNSVTIANELKIALD